MVITSLTRLDKNVKLLLLFWLRIVARMKSQALSFQIKISTFLIISIIIVLSNKNLFIF